VARAAGSAGDRLPGDPFSFLLVLSADENVGESADGFLLDPGLDVQQLLPDISGSRLAVIELVLGVGVHRLHVVEDQRESDQTTRDRHGAENDGAKSHRLQRRFLFIHFDVGEIISRDRTGRRG
jgi:hypothetical protein